jgi:hypothetical protein
METFINGREQTVHAALPGVATALGIHLVKALVSAVRRQPPVSNMAQHDKSDGIFTTPTASIKV